MIQSISYDLTDNESTLLKVSAKMFKEPYKFKSFIESNGIRSLIDPASHEYKLMRDGFSETKEGKIQKVWYKLLYIMSTFTQKIDFKKMINENVEKQLRRYSDYERHVKMALSEYILFLRTGSCACYGRCCELAENMTIDSMVDLLSGELYLRTNFYKNKTDEIIVEIVTLHYDYDEIYKEYGVDKTREYDPKDEDYTVYEKYIKYITTTEHTKRLINYRRMIAQMYAR